MVYRIKSGIYAKVIKMARPNHRPRDLSRPSRDALYCYQSGPFCHDGQGLFSAPHLRWLRERNLLSENRLPEGGTKKDVPRNIA